MSHYPDSFNKLLDGKVSPCDDSILAKMYPFYEMFGLVDIHAIFFILGPDCYPMISKPPVKTM